MTSKPTCTFCGRPSWKSHGGMGGGILPDHENNCIQFKGHDCRIAHAGYVSGLREGIRMASLDASDTLLKKIDLWLESYEDSFPT